MTRVAMLALGAALLLAPGASVAQTGTGGGEGAVEAPPQPVEEQKKEERPVKILTEEEKLAALCASEAGRGDPRCAQ